MTTASVSFLASSSALALIMARHYEEFSKTKLADIFAAPTDDDRFMISGDTTEETYLAYMAEGLSALAQETGFFFSVQTVDEEFRLYRITMA